MDRPNYQLLESLLNNIWRVKFGNPTSTICNFLFQPNNQNVYDVITKIVSDPNSIIDCQFAKIIFRIVLDLRNRYETFQDYCEWRNVEDVLFPTWPTFLDNNKPDVFDYIIIEGLPGITLENIPTLQENAYLETYWYSPKATAYILENDLDESLEHPGVHCIYHHGMWIYFDYHGPVKITDVNIIINKIISYCIEVLNHDPGLIVMNPEDTRIAFNC